jgi:hypothetical protein
MEGFNCAGSGDPSMIVLTPQVRLTERVTFKTYSSPQINSQNVGVVMTSASTGTLTLDGVPVSAASFTAYPACNTWSYATVSFRPAPTHWPAPPASLPMHTAAGPARATPTPFQTTLRPSLTRILCSAYRDLSRSIRRS